MYLQNVMQKYFLKFNTINKIFTSFIYCIIFTIFIFNPDNLYANDNFDFFYTVTNLNGGLNFFSDKPFEYSGGFGNFFFEHKKTHFGLEYEILKISVFYHENVYENYHRIYFFNPKFYWNILKNENNIFGPFISINYLTLENPFDKFIFSKEFWDFKFNKIIINGGLSILWKIKIIEKSFLPMFIGGEFGYKYNIDSHGIYFRIFFHFA